MPLWPIELSPPANIPRAPRTQPLYLAFQEVSGVKKGGVGREGVEHVFSTSRSPSTDAVRKKERERKGRKWSLLSLSLSLISLPPTNWNPPRTVVWLHFRCHQVLYVIQKTEAGFLKIFVSFINCTYNVRYCSMGERALKSFVFEAQLFT